MPIYVYQHPKTEEYIEVLQGMNDPHEYRGNDKVEWKRVFFAPNAGFDTQVDPYSRHDYLKATANKKGTLGDLMDYSKELSQKRADKDGKDPVAEKFYANHEKETGIKHPSKGKVYESKNVRVEYD